MVGYRERGGARPRRGEVTWEWVETGVELKTLDLRDDAMRLGGTEIRVAEKP
jgi:hypothetical protein